MIYPTIEELQAVMAAKGYVFFTDGDYNLNIIGIRSSYRLTNRFDDTLVLAYKEGGYWRIHYIPCTTDPGLGPVERPRRGGVAVLKEGQYPGAYRLGLHKGKQRALVQVKPVTVWRDENGDHTYDRVRSETGMFGINIHWSSTVRDSVQVDNWSEGCQVGSGAVDYGLFLSLLDKAVECWGNSFTYTLLSEADFVLEG